MMAMKLRSFVGGLIGFVVLVRGEPYPDGFTKHPECYPPGSEKPFVRGRLKLPKEASTLGLITVPSFNECASFCFNTRYQDAFSGAAYKCGGFGYNPHTKLCYLYTNVFGEDQVTQSSQGPLMLGFVDGYYCQDPCEATSKENLLKNPDFELSDTLYGPWEVSPKPSIVKGYNSSRALSIPAGRLEVLQSITICPNRQYAFQYDIKIIPADRNQTSLRIFTLFGDLYAPSEIPTGEWYTVTGSASNTDVYHTAALRVYSVENATRILFGNTKVVRASGITTTLGPNLVENGGFESGALAPWNYSHYGGFDALNNGNGHVISQGLTEGNHSFNFKQPFKPFPYGEDDYLNEGGFALSQEIVTVPEKDYEISFDFLSSPNTADIIPLFFVTAGTYGWGNDGRAYFYLPPDQLNHWARVFTATQNLTEISIGFFVEDTVTLHTDVTIDNIIVREVPKGGNIGIVKKIDVDN